ncbi:MAG TPA: response regulator transcription factor, partial [Caldilineaceae bacterium]|nr:response regulator transcription factor [Caldilineaceae bacterium]
RYVSQLLTAFAAVSNSAEVQSSVGDSTLQPISREALALISPPLVEPLTERELEILRLVAAGLSNATIAAQLVIAVGTVKTHLKRIYGKLAVKSRTQAVAQARDLDLF